jgi:hypothetical protein
MRILPSENTAWPPIRREKGRSGVKLTVERLPESRVVLDIAADEAEFAKAMDRAARKVGNQVTIPGFRKGKAPRGMIERAYGRQVFIEEAHRLLMDDLYRNALKEAAVNPVGDPRSRSPSSSRWRSRSRSRSTRRSTPATTPRFGPSRSTPPSARRRSTPRSRPSARRTARGSTRPRRGWSLAPATSSSRRRASPATATR